MQKIPNTRLREGYRVANFKVLPAEGIISGPAGTTHVEPRAMDVLNYLAAHADEVVDRNELLENVWRSLCVTDSCLYKCVCTLRKALADDQRRQRIIQTVPKRGYRLTGPVRPLERREHAFCSRWCSTIGGVVMAYLVLGAMLGARLVTRAPFTDETNWTVPLLLLPAVIGCALIVVWAVRRHI